MFERSREGIAILTSVFVHAVILLFVVVDPIGLGFGRPENFASAMEVSLVRTPTADERPPKSKKPERIRTVAPSLPNDTEIESTSKVVASSAPVTSAFEGGVDAPVDLQTASLDVGGGPTSVYFGSILQKLNRLKRYPADAMRRNEQGAVEIVFELKKDGRIGEARVKRAAPYEELNEAALAAVMRLGKVQAIPDSVSRSDLKLSVPFVFEIR